MTDNLTDAWYFSDETTEKQAQIIENLVVALTEVYPELSVEEHTDNIQQLLGMARVDMERYMYSRLLRMCPANSLRRA